MKHEAGRLHECRDQWKQQAESRQRRVEELERDDQTLRRLWSFAKHTDGCPAPEHIRRNEGEWRHCTCGLKDIATYFLEKEQARG